MATKKALEIAVQEPAVVIYDSGAETLTSKVAALRNAQKLFSTYSQEQMGQIPLAAAMAANHQRIPLVKLAAAETGMGIVEDKVIKSHYASEYIYNVYKNTKTCGALEQDTSFGVQTVVEPTGAIAAVVPTTNPTSTAIFKMPLCLKTRNAILICPHPRVEESTTVTARMVLNAVVATGVSKGIITWIDAPSVELTNQIMKETDLILATGGPGMVQAAYSSGKPVIGVGTGNTPVITDDSADLILAVNSVTHPKTFDNGMTYASEQPVIVLDGAYEQVKAEFTARGCCLLNSDETEKVRQTILINGVLNFKIVGQFAHAIAKLSGLDVPENAKILTGEVEGVESQEVFAHEKLSPVLTMYRAKDSVDAIQKAKRLVVDGGYGHTSSLYISTVTEPEKLRLFTVTMKTCRVLINTPAAQGGIGDLYNFKLPLSLTLGCGSWGGNPVSENIGVRHLLDIETVVERRENVPWFRAPEEVYFKRGCLSVALDELKDVLNKKRALLIIDEFLFRNGYTKSITDRLDKLGTVHTTFFNAQPGPTLHCTKEGAVVMKAFVPDCIIVLGGGPTMDVAKIIWTMYEHSEVDFMDLAMRFMDIRKRVYTFPKMGEKAYLIAISTSADTDSEVTPSVVVTDEATSIKYPLADYELMPEMVIVSVDSTMYIPKGLITVSGIDAMTHALEAYAAMLATDYIDGLVLKALKNISTYLPRVYEHGAVDPIAREKMADASTIVGTAFVNAFLDVYHSMAHELGAFHHLPHDVVNALMITYVMRFNANPCPVKMGTFPQYQYPHTLERYRECADFFGTPDKDEEEKSNGLIAAVGELKAKTGTPKSIQTWGVDEAALLATLDEITKHVSDDQYTGANPRYPLMSEIRQMCLDAYHGR